MFRTVTQFLLIIALAFAAPQTSHARKTGASVLPESTKAYVSVNDPQRLQAAWLETQLGQLCQDPAMKPFVEDVWRQVRENLSETNSRLAIELHQIRAIAKGEVCLAALEPSGNDTHAVILMVDVDESDAAVGETLRQVEAKFKSLQATRHVQTIEGLSVVRYDVPSVGEVHGHEAYYLVHGGKLIATDHIVALRAVATRLRNENAPSLASLEAYRVTQEATELQSGRVVPDLRWYIEPFGYTRIIRSSARVARKRGTDMLKTFQEQGFDVIQAVGGQVALHTDEHEILHRTMIYAPGEKKLAARLLDYPNGPTLAPSPWVPDNVANYISFRWNMAEAFEASKTLINEIAGEKFFDEFLDNLENEPNGPRINVRRDLIRHLGRRVTFISDCTHPVTPRCERFLIAIEVTDTDAVSQTINQALHADPTARRQLVDGLAVWEIVGDEADEDLVLTVEFESPGLGFGAPKADEPKEQAPAMPNSAIAVVDGRLLISSHIEFLKEVVRGLPEHPLSGADDYARVSEALEKLGAGQECSRIFSRSDETYHATYELVRSGKMPDSESLLGKMLNYMRPEEEKGRREQNVDGSKLPSFEVVRHYLGPAGVYTEAHAQGWTLTGCLLGYLPRSAH